MPSPVHTCRALVRWFVLVPALAGSALLAGCGPSPGPEPAVPPPAAAPTTLPSSSPAASASAPVSVSPAAPSGKAETAADVDYGAPPRARCVERARISTPSSPSTPAERKAARYAKAKKLLEEGYLLLELDARRAGVSVPPRYAVKRLVLAVGYHMPQPIPDLVVDASGVSGQLLFNRTKRFPVRVPWEAVYGLSGEDGGELRWLEDVPADVLCVDEEPVDNVGTDD